MRELGHVRQRRAQRVILTGLGLSLFACADRAFGDDEIGEFGEVTTVDATATSDTTPDESTSTESDTAPDESTSTDSTDSESTTTESTTTESTDSESTGDSGFLCDCVEFDPICTPNAVTAMHDCALPSPCGLVDGNAVAADCVLHLLIAGEAARFEYDIISAQGCGAGYNKRQGWFYILDPDQGLETECFIDECENGIGEPPSQTPLATHQTIAEPAHFADCLGKTASIMTACIFSGLSPSTSITECP